MPRGEGAEAGRLGCPATGQAWPPERLVYELGAFIDELSEDADGDFGDGAGADVNACGAGEAGELFFRGEVFTFEMIEDGACFAGAADHGEEEEGAVDPVAEDEGIVAVSPGDDEGEGWRGGEGFGEECFPGISAEAGRGWEEAVVDEGGAVIEDGDVEVELEGDGGDGLGDMAGAGDPECAGRANGFGVAEAGELVGVWQGEE